MTILLVTYDLKQPGRNYAPVHEYLKQFTYCKDLESVWLLDTTLTAAQVRDGLTPLIDGTDTTLVVPVGRAWASYNFSCGAWLNDPVRRW